MSAIDVGEIDPGDEMALRSWWEVGRAAEAERALDLWTPWEVSRVALATQRPWGRTVLLAAFEDGRVVGSGVLDLSDRDNTHLAHLTPYVAPADRGRGVGSAVLAALERRAAGEGRTTLMSGAHVPPDGDSAGRRFAHRHGYQVASQDTIKAADLAATERSWPELAARAAERADGYALIRWGDRAPDEHVEGIAALFSRFLGEIPLGDLDLEPQSFDVERIRHGEERRINSGVGSLLVAATAPDGELVGYTNLSAPRGTPRVAEIDSTLVLPEHRGHRLGLALKVQLHQLLRAEFPDTELLVTGNADVNQHMNAINDLLGYRPVERVLELQKVLA